MHWARVYMKMGASGLVGLGRAPKGLMKFEGRMGGSNMEGTLITKSVGFRVK